MNYSPQDKIVKHCTRVVLRDTECKAKAKAVDEILARLEAQVPKAEEPLKPSLMCCLRALEPKDHG